MNRNHGKVLCAKCQVNEAVDINFCHRCADYLWSTQFEMDGEGTVHIIEDNRLNKSMENT